MVLGSSRLLHSGRLWAVLSILSVVMGSVVDSKAGAPSFAARRAEFLRLSAEAAGRNVCTELSSLALGSGARTGPILRAVEKLERREDCADFALHDLLRLLYQFGGRRELGPVRHEVEQAILGFKYWPDEPGVDSMCTWTENHYILFASGAYLAGQLFPRSTFRNSGRTGQEMMTLFRPRILRWLDLRFRTGFSEWLSNVYYALDIAALLNLIDFCRDAEIAQRATMVLDLLLADIALNQFRGAFASTHGRSYFRSKVDASHEATASVCALLFGWNNPVPGNRPATYLALSPRYRMPAVLRQVARDTARTEMVNRQRMSIRIEEAERWGLDPDRLEDGMLFLTYGAYFHPRTADLMVRMLDLYGWWENGFFSPFRRYKWLLTALRKTRTLSAFARLFGGDLSRNLRTEVNIYTYRTPEYMLSTAQDYRKGGGGDQHHVWNAALGPRAVCFTTHPARVSDESPGYWTGSGSLPRAAQFKNVVIVLYRFSTRPAFYVRNRLRYTHAWFPRDEFDEVVERDGWIFARKGDGYLALWSREPYKWRTEGRYAHREIIAPGTKNIWICELGSKRRWGTFEAFVTAISNAELKCGDGLHIRYDSPSQGNLEFSWDGPFLHNGRVVELDGYPRYDNPYAFAPYPSSKVTFRCGEHGLTLDWSDLSRRASGFVE